MYTLLLPFLLIPVLLSPLLADRHVTRQMCKEVSTELKRALDHGSITKRQAKRLIGNCYKHLDTHEP